MLTVVVAQSFPDGSEICYVLPGFVDNVTFAHNGLYDAWPIGRFLNVTHQAQHRGRSVNLVFIVYL